jgi:tetratricopeptide (TPR) repeat protein
MEKKRLKALLEEGVAAAKAGQKERARQCLIQVVEADENNEQAWLWLSGVVDGLEDKQVCLENVLALNPDSVPASKGLTWIVQQRARQGLPPLPQASQPVAPAPSEPSSTLSEETIPRERSRPTSVPVVAPAPISTPLPPVFYERRRKRESRSVALKLLGTGWVVIGSVIMILGGLMLLGFIYIKNNPDYMNEMGYSRERQVMVLEAIQQVGPYLYMYAAALAALGVLYVALGIGLFMRLKIAYYASFIVGILSVLLFFLLMNDICCPILSLIFFILTFFTGDDFAVEEVAIQSGYAPSAPAYHYNLGATYIKQKKLDQAIQEWEQAVSLEPDNTRFRNALALAYAGRGQKERAIALLEETLAMAPDDTETRDNLKAVRGS